MALPRLRITGTGTSGNSCQVYLNDEKVKYCQDVLLHVGANQINYAHLVIAVGEIEADLPMGDLTKEVRTVPQGGWYTVMGSSHLRYLEGGPGGTVYQDTAEMNRPMSVEELEDDFPEVAGDDFWEDVPS